MLEELTKFASGSAGNSQAQNVVVASIATPGKGRWKIWGTARHSLIDGCKLVVGSTTVVTISAGAAGAEAFGPVVYDIINTTDNIAIQLATATGASDTASATIYAQRLSSL